MDRILTKLKLRRKSDNKSVPKNLSQENPIYDNDYVLNIDRSITYDCKRLSLSYTLLSDSPKQNHKRLTGSVSMGDLDNICLDKKVANNKKSHKRRMFWTSKPKTAVVQSTVQKRGLFSRWIFRSKGREEESNAVTETDRKLHVVWYAANNEPEKTNDSRVQFRHSLVDDPKKEIATSIAAELKSKSKSKSLFLRNTDRLSILTESEEKEKF